FGDPPLTFGAGTKRMKSVSRSRRAAEFDTEPMAFHVVPPSREYCQMPPGPGSRPTTAMPFGSIPSGSLTVELVNDRTWTPGGLAASSRIAGSVGGFPVIVGASLNGSIISETRLIATLLALVDGGGSATVTRRKRGRVSGVDATFLYVTFCSRA